MPSITIRNISPEAHRRLRIRAAQNGRSMQEELRVLIENVPQPGKQPAAAKSNWVEEMRTRIKEIGYVDFEPATFDESVNFPDFSEKDYHR
jgi:antitoxin FitA